MIYFIKNISAVKIMECIELDNKIKITDVHDLDLAQTLDCGQSFRWKPQDNGSFHGVAYGKA